MSKRFELRTSDGDVVCEACLVADKPWERMRGLLGRTELPRGEGMLLRPAASVHTAFMRFPIDVVFLGADGEVLDVRHSVPPWRAAACKGAKAALELPAGECSRRDLQQGDRLILAEPSRFEEGAASPRRRNRGVEAETSQ